MFKYNKYLNYYKLGPKFELKSIFFSEQERAFLSSSLSL